MFFSGSLRNSPHSVPISGRRRLKMTKHAHKKTRSLLITLSWREAQHDQTTLQDEQELKREMVQMWRRCTPSSRPDLIEKLPDLDRWDFISYHPFLQFFINETNLIKITLKPPEETKVAPFSVLPSHEWYYLRNLKHEATPPATWKNDRSTK